MAAMDDVQFLGLASDAISVVDQKFGRAAAWTMAILLVALPIGLIIIVLKWLAF